MKFILFSIILGILTTVFAELRCRAVNKRYGLKARKKSKIESVVGTIRFLLVASIPLWGVYVALYMLFISDETLKELSLKDGSAYIDGLEC